MGLPNHAATRLRTSVRSLQRLRAAAVVLTLATFGLGTAGTAAGAVPAAAGDVNPPSCADPHGWLFKQGSDHPFRIWYPEHKQHLADLANYLRHQLDETIWPKETDLMNTTPVAHTQDICLVSDVGHKGSAGDTHAKGGCDQVPATILILDSLGDIEARDVLAHEFFHALQFSLDVKCANTWWWRESTAQWAENYVYPGAEDTALQHTWPHYYLSDMDKPIDDACDCDKNREYGSYVFPFFIAREFHPDLIAQIWHKAQHESVLDAIDDVLPGGLKKQWPRFALEAWNADPVDYWKDWDGLTDGVAKEYGDPIELTADNHGVSFPVGKLPHLSAAYFNFKVKSDVRTLTVNIPAPYGTQDGTDNDDRANVQALVHVGDSIEVDDWTNVKDQFGESNRYYCLALPHENVTGLTLIFSNSQPKKDFDYGGKASVVTSNVGCSTWSGTVQGTDTNDGVKLTTTSTVTYKRKPNSPDGAPNYYVSGSTSYAWSGTDSQGCTVSGSGTFNDTGLSMFMHWNSPPSSFVTPRDYTAGLGGFLSYPGTKICPPPDGGTQDWNANFDPWAMNPDKIYRVAENGTTLSGSYTDAQGPDTSSWSWNLASPG